MGTTYQCTCGATVRFKQDLRKEPGTTTPTWKCRECGTQIPGMTAERIRHQHPS
jgi:DNA-directed RNA polymerase subunit RPC12/RpoP